MSTPGAIDVNTAARASTPSATSRARTSFAREEASPSSSDVATVVISSSSRDGSPCERRGEGGERVRAARARAR